MRRALILTLLLAGTLLVGCASQQGSMGPELESSKQEVDQRLVAVDAVEDSIRDELDQFENLESDVRGLMERTAEMDLPFSLLRLVAMNCINTEYEGGASEVVDVGGRPLTCRPAHIDQLRGRIEEGSTVEQDVVYDLLYVVDQARLLRGSLRRRIARLPTALEEHEEFIADERARIRQLESDLEQERNVYSTREWDEVVEYLDEYRGMLEELEQRLEEVRGESVAWPGRVDDLVTAVYFELAYLRRLESSASAG